MEGIPPIDTDTLLHSALSLREALGSVRLPFEVPAAGEAREVAAAATLQLDDYVLPRLRDVDAPVLAVVGGSTGAGKSTLVNSLVGATVSVSGVIRPTTRAALLVHHPSAARWFADGRILPSLARVHGRRAHPGELQLVSSDAVPPMLAVLDAPDIDSVVDANRALAAQLLEAADLWVFVTTAARYADAVPWAFLRRAAERGVVIGLVLDRVPVGATAEVAAHLTQLLQAEGLGDAPLFTIEEQALTDDRLPDAAVVPLRSWLTDLAAGQEVRSAVVRRTLAGTVADLAARAEQVAVAVDEQDRALAWFEERATAAFDGAATSIDRDVRDGTVMRGEVLARWQEIVGTGELLRYLESTLGRWRDRVVAAVTGRPTTGERFQGAVTTGVELLVLERVAQAHDEIVGHWRSHAAGGPVLRALADDGTDISRPSPDLAERTQRMVRDWQGSLVELVRREAGGKRRTARVLSYGVNGVALVSMVAVFSQTGGLTGAEAAIAGGSSAVGQKLLEALLGDQFVRRIATEARADLQRRSRALLDQEAARCSTALDGFRPGPDAGRLRAAATALRQGVGS